VVTDSNLNVYAFWLDERDNPTTLWYKVHDGSSWSADLQLTDSTASPNGYFGVTVSPNNDVHVCWQDYRSGNAEIYHTYYDGASWSAEEAVTSNGFLSVYPRIAPDSANGIHLFYGGATHLRYLSWNFPTQTWGGGQDFPTQFTSPHADIGVDLLTGDRHIVFADYIGYSVIFYKKYDAASAQWEPDLQLTTAASGSYEPQITTDAANLVYTVWYDYRCGTGQEEIFFKHSLPAAIEEKEPEEHYRSPNLLLLPSLSRGRVSYRYSINNVGPFTLTLLRIDGSVITRTTGCERGCHTALVPPLPSGIYLLRLEQNGVSVTRKLTIIE
jgi:hypothetical protein